MTCKNCDSNRIMRMYGKCNDLGNYEVPHLSIDHNGYAPYVDGVCSGDEIRLDFCLDCGVIQDYNPMTDEELKESFLE